MKAATSMEESHDTKSCSYRIKSEEKEKRLGTCTASATSGGNRVDDGSNSNEANCTTTPREISTGRSWHHINLFEFHLHLLTIFTTLLLPLRSPNSNNADHKVKRCLKNISD